MATRARAAARTAVPSETADIARCLSFVNTVSGRQTESPCETMENFEALVGWAREAGLLTSADAERLSARARRRQDEAEGVLARARELRELLHDTFSATSTGHAPAPATLEGLSTHLARWYTHGRLVPGDDSLQWIYAGDNDLDRVLWEVARAASRLLTSSRLQRVRPCAASTCGWWFLDDTKNASRRWCDMKICGNREKLRRFREARRART